MSDGEPKITVVMDPRGAVVSGEITVPVFLSRTVPPRKNGRIYVTDVEQAERAIRRALADYLKALPMREP